jgi:hypothetical protein
MLLFQHYSSSVRPLAQNVLTFALLRPATKQFKESRRQARLSEWYTRQTRSVPAIAILTEIIIGESKLHFTRGLLGFVIISKQRILLGNSVRPARIFTRNYRREIST